MQVCHLILSALLIPSSQSANPILHLWFFRCCLLFLRMLYIIKEKMQSNAGFIALSNNRTMFRQRNKERCERTQKILCALARHFVQRRKDLHSYLSSSMRFASHHFRPINSNHSADRWIRMDLHLFHSEGLAAIRFYPGKAGCPSEPAFLH
jgi:hypothetical protein